MADKVQFELVSPEKILLSEEVDMVVVPGTEGNFGVLPGHAPLISSVRPGLIEVYEGNAVVERIFVAGGFAEVTQERCTVLADDAVDVSALDRATVEADIARLERDLENLRGESNREDGDERARQIVEREYRVATAKLEAIELAAAR